MKLSLNVLILLSLALYANALVYYTKMDKGANGCKPKPAAGKLDKPSTRDDTATPDPGAAGGEIKVGEFAKDENTCGVNVCQNTEGDAIVLYCQKPAPFEMCNTDGVSTKAPFPECCWKCVAYTNCEETGGTTGNGETTAAPGDAATDAPALRTMPKKGTKNRKAIDFKKY